LFLQNLRLNHPIARASALCVIFDQTTHPNQLCKMARGGCRTYFGNFAVLAVADSFAGFAQEHRNSYSCATEHSYLPALIQS
jgi:hypothetical protein